MPTLKLHYDGWIVLPTGILRSLGLSSGDQIEADLVDGALVLRPAGKSKARSAAARNAGDLTPAGSEQGMLRLVEDPSTSRKTQPTPTTAVENTSAPKRRGRPPKVAAGVEAPRVQANPIVGIGPAKLIKKAKLVAKTVSQEVPLAPVARIRPERLSQPVERRPFRNVEVRTLGPGRGHNRSRRVPPGSTV